MNKVTREQVTNAVKAILGNEVYNNMGDRVPLLMKMMYAAVKAFISDDLPYSSLVLRQGLIQLEKENYLK